MFGFTGWILKYFLSGVILVQIPQWGEEEEEDIFNNFYMYDPSVYADADFWNRPKTNRNAAVLLTVGFLPGMKVAAVTMSQSKKVQLGGFNFHKVVSVFFVCFIDKEASKLFHLTIIYF